MARPNRKEEILQIAYELFTEKGFTETTIRDICRASGLTSAGLYHYFKSKEALLNGVERSIYQEFEALFDEVHEDPEQDIRSFIRSYVELFLTHKNLLHILIERSLYKSEGEFADECLKRRRDFVLNLKKRLERAKEAGLTNSDAKPIMATFHLIAMCSWTSLWFNPDGQVTKEELIQSISDFLIKGYFKNK